MERPDARSPLQFSPMTVSGFAWIIQAVDRELPQMLTLAAQIKAVDFFTNLQSEAQHGGYEWVRNLLSRRFDEVTAGSYQLIVQRDHQQWQQSIHALIRLVAVEATRMFNQLNLGIEVATDRRFYSMKIGLNVMITAIQQTVDTTILSSFTYDPNLALRNYPYADVSLDQDDTVMVIKYAPGKRGTIRVYGGLVSEPYRPDLRLNPFTEGMIGMLVAQRVLGDQNAVVVYSDLGYEAEQGELVEIVWDDWIVGNGTGVTGCADTIQYAGTNLIWRPYFPDIALSFTNSPGYQMVLKGERSTTTLYFNTPEFVQYFNTACENSGVEAQSLYLTLTTDDGRMNTTELLGIS
jgi:hypothetical protein